MRWNNWHKEAFIEPSVYTCRYSVWWHPMFGVAKLMILKLRHVYDFIWGNYILRLQTFEIPQGGKYQNAISCLQMTSLSSVLTYLKCMDMVNTFARFNQNNFKLIEVLKLSCSTNGNLNYLNASLFVCNAPKCTLRQKGIYFLKVAFHIQNGRIL